MSIKDQIRAEIAWLKSLRPQPKQEWSEEDEENLKWLCRIVHSQRVTNNLITLKEESELGEWIDKWLNHNPNPHWKPSEEDDEMLDAMIDMVSNALYEPLCPREGMLAWLKSLRPSWKPSEEQMDRLSSIIAALRKDYCDDMADFLASIYHNLKKLM